MPAWAYNDERFYMELCLNKEGFGVPMLSSSPGKLVPFFELVEAEQLSVAQVILLALVNDVTMLPVASDNASPSALPEIPSMPQILLAAFLKLDQMASWVKQFTINNRE